MAHHTLREVEERDKGGSTIRVNPSVIYKQDPQIRRIRGRHDFDYIPNPDFHPPITAQAQNGVILFFRGTPDSRATRALAVEIPQTEVPAYIVDELEKHPMRVREIRPTVYEVKLARVGEQEVVQVAELQSQDGGNSITVSPVAPKVDPPNAVPPMPALDAESVA